MCLKTSRTLSRRVVGGAEQAGPTLPGCRRPGLSITAVTVEKRRVSEVARSYGVARSWVYALLARYRAEGEAAFEPRSRRPKTSPNADRRRDGGADRAAAQGPVRAGPGRRAAHHRLAPGAPPPDPGLTGYGQPDPGPPGSWSPRPRPSGRSPPTSGSRPSCRTSAGSPTSPTTRSPAAPDTEILTWLDDHSRYALSLTAHTRVTGPAVLAAFRAAVEAYGAAGLNADRHSRWVSCREALHGPAGGVRLPGDRRLPVVVADRSGHTACVTSCLLFTGRAGVPPRMAGPC